MPLELRPLAKEDAQEAVALLTASYKNNNFRAIVLPNGMSQATLDKFVEERREAVDDPDKYVLKVVDTDNNDKMAGCAVWEHTKAMTDEDWERVINEAPKAYPEARHDIVDPLLLTEKKFKRRVMGHTRWFPAEHSISIVLDALSTLPEYQRRGVGSMLMEWGIDKLEEMKVPGFIVSTNQGYGLYLKYGFKEVGRWEVDMSRWPPGEGMYKNAFLTRMPSDHASVSPSFREKGTK